MTHDSSITHSLKNPILAVISSNQEGPNSKAPISAAGILGLDIVCYYLAPIVSDSLYEEHLSFPQRSRSRSRSRDRNGGGDRSDDRGRSRSRSRSNSRDRDDWENRRDHPTKTTRIVRFLQRKTWGGSKIYKCIFILVVANRYLTVSSNSWLSWINHIFFSPKRVSVASSILFEFNASFQHLIWSEVWHRLPDDRFNALKHEWLNESESHLPLRDVTRLHSNEWLDDGWRMVSYNSRTVAVAFMKRERNRIAKCCWG